MSYFLIVESDLRHDILFQVSWGTKGSDTAEVLPSVSSKKKGDAPAEVEDLKKAQEDIDSAFQETVTRAVAKPVKVEVKEKPTMDVRVNIRLTSLFRITMRWY